MTVRAARVPLLVGVVLLALVMAASAQAATLMVTTSSDPDNGAGSCSTGGSCSLREAVNQANLDGGDVIMLPANPSPYTLSSTFGPLLFSASVTLTGGGASSTTISGAGATRIMYVDSGASVHVSGVTLENGNGSSGSGGAAIVQANAALDLTDSVLSGNSTTVGGGGAIEDNGALQIQGSTITGNHAVGDGGAIEVSGAGTDSASATLTDSIISNNQAGQTGGAIREQSGTTGAAVVALRISGSTFVENSASTNGGAIEDSNGGSHANVFITDSTFEGNVAGGTGGGLYLGNGPDPDAVYDDTLFGNATGPSGHGGDVGLGGGVKPTFADTIVADGVSPNGPDCFGTVSTAGNNLDSANGCGFVPAPTGTDLVNTFPDLGPLQDNGGPTPTMALLSGSPAIDSGSRFICAATDQRGVPRPQGSACDIGAYESAPPVIGRASASSVGTTTAVISAPVANPDVQGGTVVFEIGTSTSYTFTSNSFTLPASLAATAFPLTLSGLTPATVYHYRLVAENADRTVTGLDEQFTTAGVPLPTPMATPTPPVNTFTLGVARVSSSGRLIVALGAADAGHFRAKATFTVRGTVVKQHKKKHVTTSYTYGTGSVSSTGRGNFDLGIGLSRSAARELKKIGSAEVLISVTFTPTGGSSHEETTRVPVKRSRRGKYM